MPSISFVVPVHNTSKYIRECVESLLDVIGIDNEVILIDDNSTDKSYSICKEYEKKYSHIHVFQTVAPFGVSIARNIGIENAKNEWIFFVDSDDKVKSECINGMTDQINACNNADIILCDYYYRKDNIYPAEFLSSNYHDIKKHKQKIMQSMINKDDTLSNNSVVPIGVPWAKLYRRSFLIESQIRYPVGVSKMQDCIFNLYCFQHSDNIKYISKKVYIYRLNPASVTNRYNGFNFGVAKQYLSELQHFVREYYGQDDNWLKTYYKKVLDCYFETISLVYAHVKCEIPSKDAINEMRKYKNNEPYNMVSLYLTPKDLHGKKKVLFSLYRLNNGEFLLYWICRIYYKARYILRWDIK